MAAKKSFQSRNPALQFIGSSNFSQEEKNTSSDTTKKVNKKLKKDSIFLSRETKSKRVILLMKPSLHQKIKEISLEVDLSVNDLIHRVLKDFVNRR